MTENSRTDPSKINKFILDAALNKWPVFGSFQELCETRKNQKFDYVDFEWKYYQYYNGNRDLTIERSQENSSAVTFSDLPMDVLEKVVEKSDLVACLSLRKVAHDLRNLVHSTKIHCQNIGFHFGYHSSRIELGNLTVEYESSYAGYCNISKKELFFDPTSIIVRGSLEEVMLADASTILKNPKLEVDSLSICVERDASCSEFLKLLQSLNFQLNVRSIYIDALGEHILSILERLKSGNLERISLNPYKMTLDQSKEMAETEQWKKATKLGWRGFSCLPLRVKFSDWIRLGSFLHFKDIRIINVYFDDENVIFIRDILLKFTHLEFCHLGDTGLGAEQSDWESPLENHSYEDLEPGEGEDDRIGRILSEDTAYNSMTRRFSIPNSRDYFQLKFKMCSDHVAALQFKRFSSS